MNGHENWLALEVKALVIPRERKKLGDWTRFCTSVTKKLKLRGTLHGTFALITSPPWSFNQTQGTALVTAFVEALVEVAPDLEVGAGTNLGPRIAKLFPKWPQKRSASSPRFDRNQGRMVYDPENLGISLLGHEGCSVEIGASGYAGFEIDTALIEAVSGLFESKDGRDARPNEQLGAARQKGASETVLLLDSHIWWKPNLIARKLKSVDQTLLSNIDAVYLVTVANSRVKVKRVWPRR